MHRNSAISIGNAPHARKPPTARRPTKTRITCDKTDAITTEETKAMAKLISSRRRDETGTPPPALSTQPPATNYLSLTTSNFTRTGASPGCP